MPAVALGPPWLVTVVLLAALAGAAALVALELRRGRERVVPRVLASVVAAGALAVLALRPLRAPAPGPGALVVLTAGAERLALRPLLDSLRGGAIVSLEEVAPAARRGETVPSFAAALVRHPGAREVHVAGDGPDAADLALAADRLLVAHLAPAPAGLVGVAAPPSLPLGESLEVRLMLGADSGGSRLRLREPGGAVADSAPGAGRVVLRAMPRAAGTWWYAVERLQGSRVVERESVGVEVVAAPAPRVLEVRARPVFESRFLREWVTARGGSMAVRTTVSRGVARTLTGGAEPPAAGLGARDLAGADGVVTDDVTLRGLTGGERTTLQRWVESGGALLVERRDERGDGSVPFTAAIRAGDEAGDRLARVQEPGTPALAGSVPLPSAELVPGPLDRVLLADVSGRAVAVARRSGLGTIVTTLVHVPSRWLLEGEPRSYGAYFRAVLWRHLPARGAAVRPLDEPAREHHRATLRAPADEPGPLLVTDAGGATDTVWLRASTATGDREGAWWPRAAGWHRVIGTRDTLPRHVAVFPADAWRGQEAATRRSALAASSRRTTPDAPRPIAGEPVDALPPALPWLCFVLSAGYLWWEDRRGRLT